MRDIAIILVLCWLFLDSLCVFQEDFPLDNYDVLMGMYEIKARDMFYVDDYIAADYEDSDRTSGGAGL